MADGAKYMSCVKIGSKGQIVIPKEVRDMFSVKAGDTLLLLADAERGIALERYETVAQIADAVLENRVGANDEGTCAFARGVKAVGDGKN